MPPRRRSIPAPIPASSSESATPAAAVRLVGYVSAARLAELLDCSESKVWDMARKGQLPRPSRHSGMTRWKWADVERRMDGAGDSTPGDPILEASRGT